VTRALPAAAAFTLPRALEAHEPPEARGLERDAVRMLVAERATGRLDHRRARDLPGELASGDLVVVNTSATLPAALRARRASGDEVDLHLSVPMPGSTHRLVELRRDGARVRDGRPGEVLELPAGGRARLVAPYLSGPRLWAAALTLPAPLAAYLGHHGRPIRYRHVPRAWPLSEYQTVYALVPGSSEMPSAGRPLTTGLITALVARGIAVAPIVLHAGVSSPEEGEPPVPEPYRVPPATARLVEVTRRAGGRVVAVGTTVVRALETVAEPGGGVRAGEGFTRVLVTPRRGVRVVDGLLTGWHEPDAPHLSMLRAVGGADLVERSYAAALEAGYLWHEFGDVHLILP
jgi:S-adenosylmethionine:tRNA ribosyltransferase-isomerase